MEKMGKQSNETEIMGLSLNFIGKAMRLNILNQH